MQRTPKGWTVLDEAAGVYTLTYSFGGGKSNTFTAKLASGGLMVVSPAAGVDAAVLDELASFGPVEALVANNGFHHFGLAQWKAHFPDARCFAAPGAITRIKKRSKDAPELEPLSALEPLLGDDVAVIETASSKCGETWARVKTASGYVWYASDLLVNLAALPEKLVPRLLFKMTKSAPGYRVFGLATKFIIKDAKATFAGMHADLEAHPPAIMVPAHGRTLTQDNLASETKGLLQAYI